ncbi:hypothetical protein E2C01_054860 [Portunus trituberculatus]|uniref:Uncharacterized protein n=1 Tax=Portunus trituberculatus TaxID=210409 RepID=A0A5B7GT61_PORTR|nr:hypothetical protein [Portunus trituberculatus]
MRCPCAAPRISPNLHRARSARVRSGALGDGGVVVEVSVWLVLLQSIWRAACPVFALPADVDPIHMAGSGTSGELSLTCTLCYILFVFQVASFVPWMVCLRCSSGGMSEQGVGRKDASPRRPCKKSDRTSSVDRGSRGKESVPTAPREFEPVPSTSQLSSVTGDTAQATGEKLDRLTALLSGFIEKCSARDVTATPDFSGFHDVLSSDKSPNGSFIGEEKGEPLADNLAQILNQSLRRRPNDDSVKATAAKVKLLINVDNFTLPMTNDDVAKALSLGGRLLDARVSRTTCLLSKAIVPLARFLSDFGDKKNLSLDHYVMDLNSSLRFLQLYDPHSEGNCLVVCARLSFGKIVHFGLRSGNS